MILIIKFVNMILTYQHNSSLIKQINTIITHLNHLNFKIYKNIIYDYLELNY